MDTSLQIEINEIAEVLLSFGQNRISIPELLKILKYKDPISYKHLTYFKLKNEFVKLFPLYKNKRKNTYCFKISQSQTNKNRKLSLLRLKPFKDINIKAYGIFKANYETL